MQEGMATPEAEAEEQEQESSLNLAIVQQKKGDNTQI